MQLQALAKDLRIERVTFSGPAYGYEKSQAYWSADLFVLPTHSENFGLVVAEALAHGVPAVVNKSAPWSGLEKEKCGWWVDVGVEPLTECLREAMSKSSEELFFIIEFFLLISKDGSVGREAGLKVLEAD